MDIYPDFGKLSHALCYKNTGPPHTYLFPTSAMKEINGFDASDRVNGGHEDYDLLCRLSLKGYEVVALHTIGCVYRRSPNSMSTNVEGMRRSRKKVWLHFVEGLLENKNDVFQLVHLLGGYALRLASKDIRYEAVNLLDQIVTGLEQCEMSIPTDLAVEICEHVVTIRRSLPKAINFEERKLEDLSVIISDRLARLAIANIDEKSVLEPKTKSALIRLAKYLIASWSEHGIVDLYKSRVNALASKKILLILRSLLKVEKM